MTQISFLTNSGCAAEDVVNEATANQARGCPHDAGNGKRQLGASRCCERVPLSRSSTSMRRCQGEC